MKHLLRRRSRSAFKIMSPQMDKVIELINCCVCQEIPHTPRPTSCASGHVTCPECEHMILDCPQCRQKCLTKMSFTSRLMAALFDGKKAYCHFAEHGCKEKNYITGDLGEHETICPFRTIKCPEYFLEDRKCRWRGPRTKLMNHLSKAGCAKVT